jgi:hypothetical protein
MPEGVIRSILLIIAPAVTVIISSSWGFVTEEIEQRVADWRLRSQKKKVANVYSGLMNDPSATPEAREGARLALEALTKLELEIATQRARAVVAS